MTNLQPARVTIPQRGPAAASLQVLEVQKILGMLDATPNILVYNINLPKPPHESENEVKDNIWDNILQGDQEEDLRNVNIQNIKL